MKRSSWFFLLLILLLASCSSDGAGFQCQEGICIHIEFTEPVKALVPTEFIVSIKTEKDVTGLGISVYGFPGITILDVETKPEVAELAYQDERSMDWWIGTKAGEEYTIIGRMVLDKPSVSYGIFSYGLIASASYPSIARVTDSFTIYLDAEGNQVEESQAKMELETGFPLPSPPPDLTIVPETPWPTIAWPTNTPLPTPTSTLPAYPPPGENSGTGAGVSSEPALTPTLAAYPSP